MPLMNLDMFKAEEKFSELEDMSTEISKTEKQREQKVKKKKITKYPRLWDNYKRCNICKMG